MRHAVIHTMAKTLCECEGRDWLRIIPAERDRYARIAILIDDRIHALASQADRPVAPPLPEQGSILRAH